MSLGPHQRSTCAWWKLRGTPVHKRPAVNSWDLILTGGAQLKAGVDGSISVD